MRYDSSGGDRRGRQVRRRLERLDVHPQLGDAVEAGRRTADRALLLDGQVEAGDALELAIEEVHAADFHLGGRAVDGADDRAGDADQREVAVELVEDVFDLGGGDAIHREDRGHRVGVGRPGGVGPRRCDSGSRPSTASESPVTSIRSSSSRWSRPPAAAKLSRPPGFSATTGGGRRRASA